MPNKKILFVDDENFFIEPFRYLLENQGYEVNIANDGMSGLNKARFENPDIIILDLMLPNINGYQVCRLLKFDEKFNHIPVIILSAKDSERDKNIGIESGADLYLTKPIEPQLLLGEIERLLS